MYKTAQDSISWSQNVCGTINVMNLLEVKIPSLVKANMA